MCPVHKLLQHHQPYPALIHLLLSSSVSVSQMIIRASMHWVESVMTWKKKSLNQNWTMQSEVTKRMFVVLTCMNAALQYVCVCVRERRMESLSSVIWVQSYCGSKVTSLSILPFSLSMLYWDVSLLICDNVLETWWEMDNIKASIGHRWQGCTAFLHGITLGHAARSGNQSVPLIHSYAHLLYVSVSSMHMNKHVPNCGCWQHNVSYFVQAKCSKTLMSNSYFKYSTGRMN